MRPILVVIVVTGVLVPLGRYTPVAWGEDALVTVVPELSDEILANPGMGWETFHHSARQGHRESRDREPLDARLRRAIHQELFQTAA